MSYSLSSLGWDIIFDIRGVCLPVCQSEAYEPIDDCVTWGRISVPGSESYASEKTKHLSIEAPLNITCSTPKDYSFTIWMDTPDNPDIYRIGNGMNALQLRMYCMPPCTYGEYVVLSCSKAIELIVITETINLGDSLAGTWSHIWLVPSEVELDIKQVRQISFTVNPNQTTVATSQVFFLSPKAAKPSPSPSPSPQGTTFSTSTLPASGTTSAVLAPGSIPSSTSSGTDGSGLSKGASAGIAIGISVFLGLIILGGSVLYRFFKQRSTGEQKAGSPALFWNGRRPADDAGDGRAQSPASHRHTPDGREIRHLGLQHQGVQQLDGVELQPLSGKAAEVLGLEVTDGPSQARDRNEESARGPWSPPPYASPSPSSIPSYSTQPPRPPMSNVALSSSPESPALG